MLVLYYSSYGHLETMAQAVAAGAREVADTEVIIKRVPELVLEEAARKAGRKARSFRSTPLCCTRAW